jgi:hypothetical protein
MKEIGEDHDIYTMKYLRNKPIRSLEYDQFLRLKVFLIFRILYFETWILSFGYVM